MASLHDISASGRVIEQFALLDPKGTGQVSLDELRQILKLIDEATWTDEKVAQLLQMVDTNGDGFLSYTEFVNWTFLKDAPTVFTDEDVEKIKAARGEEQTSVPLLCAEALKKFKAKNLTDGDIQVSIRHVTRTVAAGEVVTYAKADICTLKSGIKIYDLEVVDPESKENGCTIAFMSSTDSGDPEDRFFKVQASDNFGHEEHWLMHFAVSGNDTWATISSAPEGR
eukprot:TRINITY_DN25139_c0_g1_i1.p1 TRINITY_DN25139_c0_g1~~TRINITY_DN25139_c0_g1_i1.p1  ORF type:complete len:235 (-),score=41.69 TRINITY_DN25139_c0_g1_i1:87-764(-)